MIPYHSLQRPLSVEFFYETNDAYDEIKICYGYTVCLKWLSKFPRSVI